MDFLRGGGYLREKKSHLMDWKLVCVDKGSSLGICSLGAFNKTLLRKWCWRFIEERETFGKQFTLKKGRLFGNKLSLIKLA